ncbi:MAG: clavaldehyde dehydrogenase, partial [Acidobacteria bacterium]
MEKELNGMAALVTGATSGIGRATALRFAEGGARVALVGRSAEGLKEVAEQIGAHGGEAVRVRADVTVEEDARRAVAEAVEHLGGLDVLVNAAGIISNGTIETTTLADWDAMMNVNLRSVFHLMQLCAPHL